MVEEYYRDRSLVLNNELARVTKVASNMYLVRLITFLLFATTLILSFSSDNRALFIIASVILLIIFISVAIYDLRLESIKRELENRVRFNDDEVKSLNHEFDFRDDGVTFANLNAHLSGDFDIFGKGSLYQYLNRSVTIRGKSRFAASLVACDLRSDVIRARTESIEELSTKIDFIEGFAAVGAEIKEGGVEIDNLLRWIGLDNSKEQFINVIRYILPSVFVVALVLSIIGYLPYSLLSIIFIISLVTVYYNTKKLNQAHVLLGRSAQILDKYSELIKLIENEEFNTDLLNRERQKLRGEKESASQSIVALKNILDRFDCRYNIYVSFVLNGLLLFDYHTFMVILKWKRDHKEVVEQWFDAVTQVDSLIGLGVYAHNCKGHTTYANVIEDEFKIIAQDMGHPLIAPDVRVSNSFEISKRPAVAIVTGANMAGKSTFLRTLAVNLMLGMNGAPICARSFAFSPVKILSSIKIQDSLMNRESYFYAELLRLSDILESIKEQSQSMIILDEILRGTNTKDKQQGSIGLIRKIIDQRGVVIIATHDLVIGKMEDDYPNYVSNYCFEVEIDGDRLSFDYKLKRGISSKLNASFLMRKMGIID